MRHLLWIFPLLLAIQHHDRIYRFFNPITDFSAQHAEQVVLYGTEWCPTCKHAKKWLDNNNIEYHEYDVENSAEGARQFRELGTNGVPTLVVNGELIVGHRPQDVLAALD